MSNIKKPDLSVVCDSHSRDKIENALIEIMQSPKWSKVLEEYHDLLSIVGNVENNEIVALVILAIGNRAKKEGWPS